MQLTTKGVLNSKYEGYELENEDFVVIIEKKNRKTTLIVIVMIQN